MGKEPMTRLLAIAATFSLLAVAGCGGDDDSESSATGEATTVTETEAPEEEKAGGKAGGGKAAAGGDGITIKTADSQVGTALFDGDDRAIYLFDKDTSDRSECYGACAEAWPPVLTEGEPEASGSVETGLLGTTERDDGATQVTYGGHPLYYYVDDPQGELLCHNVEEFGGLWLAVDPGGEAVQ
jgi:predicted lipoprotein with Yx(FWY)xxD motif